MCGDSSFGKNPNFSRLTAEEETEEENSYEPSYIHLPIPTYRIAGSLSLSLSAHSAKLYTIVRTNENGHFFKNLIMYNIYSIGEPPPRKLHNLTNTCLLVGSYRMIDSYRLCSPLKALEVHFKEEKFLPEVHQSTHLMDNAE